MSELRDKPTVDYADHPALVAIVKERDNYCRSYPPDMWNTPYLAAMTACYDAVQRVVSPKHLVMPDPPDA